MIDRPVGRGVIQCILSSPVSHTHTHTSQRLPAIRGGPTQTIRGGLTSRDGPISRGVPISRDGPICRGGPTSKDCQIGMGKHLLD